MGEFHEHQQFPYTQAYLKQMLAVLGDDSLSQTDRLAKARAMLPGKIRKACDKAASAASGDQDEAGQKESEASADGQKTF